MVGYPEITAVLLGMSVHTSVYNNLFDLRSNSYIDCGGATKVGLRTMSKYNEHGNEPTNSIVTDLVVVSISSSGPQNPPSPCGPKPFTFSA
uniref:ARAD1B22242p n=1 Tax=Blastobotrys adeninivorans TaxID=409370 RepID=A0A060TCA7_BLAAD